MNYSGLNTFIDAAIDKWKRLKADFSSNKEMRAFLSKAYPVVTFDHHQIDLEFAKNMNKPIYSDEKKASSEERKREEFRQKMVSYLENDLKEVFLEIRFSQIEMRFIQELKAHPAIKDLNWQSPASIRIIIEHIKAR